GRRRPADHPPGVLADGLHLARPLVDGYDRGLEEDDALTATVDDRVRGSEIDGEGLPAEMEQAARHLAFWPAYHAFHSTGSCRARLQEPELPQPGTQRLLGDPIRQRERRRR